MASATFGAIDFNISNIAVMKVVWLNGVRARTWSRGHGLGPVGSGLPS